METTKQITQSEFEAKANHFWSIPPDCYGSIQFAAQSARNFFKEQGIDTSEQYEAMRIRQGRNWYYAGD